MINPLLSRGDAVLHEMPFMQPFFPHMSTAGAVACVRERAHMTVRTCGS